MHPYHANFARAEASAVHSLAVGARGTVALSVVVSLVGLVCVAMLAVMFMIAVRRWPPDRGDRGDDGGGGGGGGRGPDGPELPGGGAGPTWWPEFERQFADYVARGRALYEPSTRK